ncbi:hypothetical protein ACFL96_15755 [Thermoproteota archaeon]
MKAVKLLLVGVIVVFCFIVGAQFVCADSLTSSAGLQDVVSEQDITWEMTYNSPAYALAVQETCNASGKPDGYILSGGENGFWLIRIDLFGERQWVQKYGTQGDLGARAVQQILDEDGNPDGYMLAGNTSGGQGTTSNDFCLIRTDNQGNEMWSRTYDGFGSADILYGARQTSDGGYILAGETHLPGPWFGDHDVYLIKTDALGNEVWSKNYGGMNASQYGRAVQQTPDGGYAVAGRTSAGSCDMYLIKVGPQGDFEWERSYGSPDNAEFAWSMVQTSDGGYALAGKFLFFGSEGDEYDMCLVKTDALGNEEWSRRYGASGIDCIEGTYAVRQTSDGGFILAGQAIAPDTENGDIMLVKTDACGNKRWSRYFDWGGYNDSSHAVQQTADGGYVVAGRANIPPRDTDTYVVKTDSLGKIASPETERIE